MKIKALKTYKWKIKMPEFEEGKIYEVVDDMALKMIKHGYAELVLQPQNENKMVDIQSEPHKPKILKLNKKHKKNK
jgi:hypothetical protein